MEKIIKDLEKISCACRDFRLFQQDSIVEVRPSNTQLIHDCPELTIFQDYRGIRRYFLTPPKVDEPAPEEPDTFLEGLMDRDEQDRSEEVIQEPMGEGDGETGIPF